MARRAGNGRSGLIWIGRAGSRTSLRGARLLLSAQFRAALLRFRRQLQRTAASAAGQADGKHKADKSKGDKSKGSARRHDFRPAVSWRRTITDCPVKGERAAQSRLRDFSAEHAARGALGEFANGAPALIAAAARLKIPAVTTL